MSQGEYVRMRIAEATAKGFEPDPCINCGCFTLKGKTCSTCGAVDGVESPKNAWPGIVRDVGTGATDEGRYRFVLIDTWGTGELPPFKAGEPVWIIRGVSE